MEKINKTEAIKIAEKLWKAEISRSSGSDNVELIDEANKLLMHFGPTIKKGLDNNVLVWLNNIIDKKDIRVFSRYINAVGDLLISTNGSVACMVKKNENIKHGLYNMSADKLNLELVNLPKGDAPRPPTLDSIFGDYENMDYKELHPVDIYKPNKVSYRSGMYLTVIKNEAGKEFYFDSKYFHELYSYHGCFDDKNVLHLRLDINMGFSKGYAVLMPISESNL